MSLSPPSKLFGSPRRTQVLLLLALLGESYPAELARLVEAHPFSMGEILDGLEIEGVIASRRLGRTRCVALNPRYFAARELQALLSKLAEGEPALRGLAATRRSRPQRPKKDR